MTSRKAATARNRLSISHCSSRWFRRWPAFKAGQLLPFGNGAEPYLSNIGTQVPSAQTSSRLECALIHLGSGRNLAPLGFQQAFGSRRELGFRQARRNDRKK